MIRKLGIVGALAVSALCSVPTSIQAAVAPTTACKQAVAKEGGKFFKGKLKSVSKCNDKNLKVPGSCQPGDLAAAVAKLEGKLTAGIGKKCDTLGSIALGLAGYPGKCSDPDPNDGFTSADLKTCILSTHGAIADALIAQVYGTTSGPATKEQQGCLKTVAGNAAKYASTLQASVAKCRNAVAASKITGIAPADCATDEPGTAAKVGKARTGARDKIVGACPTAVVLTLDICDPAATTDLAAADCILDAFRDRVDTAAIGSSPDLIDIEYAEAPNCGDNIKNQIDEECDGSDDGDCSGQCGAANGDFPCLCLDIPRIRVIEHSGTDLDTGWTGISHDADIVEGRGYIADLYDCDGPGGPDVVCVIGPSCTIGGAPCTNDVQCGLNGPCRKRRTAVGPRCNLNIQQGCNVNADCPGAGNFCKKTPYGPPLPLSQASTPVCSDTTFLEDVTGTINLVTGEGAVRVIQNTRTFTGGDVRQPCPTCGGFCNVAPGLGGPGGRTPCDEDEDCPAGVNCVTSNICSYGANVNKPCRPDPPFGGATNLFGTTSVDCPLTTAGTPIGVLVTRFQPATTGSQSLAPAHVCDAFGFGGKACIAAASEFDLGRPCTVDGDCPGGGAGACANQCFCPSGGNPSASPQRPNACNAACVGGANDAQPCGSDGDCDPPNGFCHLGDCRKDEGDLDSTQEGVCTAGPSDGFCSITDVKACNQNSDCTGSACPFCQDGETCVQKPRACFLNDRITRQGTPGLPDRTMASIFCIEPTNEVSVNLAAGVPGPGTIEGEQTVIITGF